MLEHVYHGFDLKETHGREALKLLVNINRGNEQHGTLLVLLVEVVLPRS